MTEQQILDRWGPVVAEVRSRSEPDKPAYKVRLHQGALNCNCMGWRIRKTCRHCDETARQLGPLVAVSAPKKTKTAVLPKELQQRPSERTDPLVKTILEVFDRFGLSSWRKVDFAQDLAANIRAKGSAEPIQEPTPGPTLLGNGKVRMIFLED